MQKNKSRKRSRKFLNKRGGLQPLVQPQPNIPYIGLNIKSSLDLLVNNFIKYIEQVYGIDLNNQEQLKIVKSVLRDFSLKVLGSVDEELINLMALRFTQIIDAFLPQLSTSGIKVLGDLAAAIPGIGTVIDLAKASNDAAIGVASFTSLTKELELEAKQILATIKSKMNKLDEMEKMGIKTPQINMPQINMPQINPQLNLNTPRINTPRIGGQIGGQILSRIKGSYNEFSNTNKLTT